MNKKITVIRDGEEISYEVISRKDIEEANARLKVDVEKRNRKFLEKMSKSKKALESIYLNT